MMLKLYQRLFWQLNQDIHYAVWKACHELQSALYGSGDIDLLVDPTESMRFQSILHENGFVRAKYELLDFPDIYHYYGYDEETGKLCHLHIYYKLVTGESHLKSYELPFVAEILSNRFLNSFSVYEISFRDQALLYTMRHNIKQASLLGFLFWIIERQDYLSEYRYILNGLYEDIAAPRSVLETEWHSVFDIQSLSLRITFWNLFKARRKARLLYKYRRFDFLKGNLSSLRNFLVRLHIKFFRVKKRLDKGTVIAVSGADGAGKSSLIRELDIWLSEEFDVKVVHLGRPSSTFLTILLRPLLFFYRLHKKRNLSNSPTKLSVSDRGLTFAIRHLALAYERYQLACFARNQALQGKVVISDRYPTKSLGKMDSPQIGTGNSFFVRWIGKLEIDLYQKLPLADSVIFLDVSIDEAIHRNRNRIKLDKETDFEIRQRHENNRNLDFLTKNTTVLNANPEFIEVFHKAQACVWQTLNS